MPDGVAQQPMMTPSQTRKDISVVFFGSGPVAAKSLELLAANFTIEAVITKPRPEHHKGSFPVIDLCEQPHSTYKNVVTVSNKRQLSDVFAAQKFESRLGVVIDFGIIIAQDVIDAFPLGIINSHFSLLPALRGADPITFSILSGQPYTGVSLMRITAGLDEGPVLATGVYDFDGTETTPSLTEALIRLSNGLLAQELPRYMSSPDGVLSQQEVALAEGRPAEPTFSRKLSKSDSLLDFTKPAVQLEREIRAYAGWPGSKTQLSGSDIIITSAHVLTEAQISNSSDIKTTAPSLGHTPGSIWRSGKQFGFYTAEGGVLIIDRLKPAGKAEMSATAFLAGYTL